MSPSVGESDSELQEHNKLLLQQFRSAVSDVIEAKHDDEFLLRFLDSRDFDLRKTEKMLRESIKFKKKIQAEDLLESGYQLPQICKDYVPTEFVCFDSDGSLVRSFHAGACDFKGIVHSFMIPDLMKVVIYYLETDLKTSKQQKKNNKKVESKSTYVIDLQHFSIKQFCDKAVVSAGAQLLTMYQDNYPETLRAAYMINAPKYFTWVFNLFKPFIDARTLSKIKIFGTVGWRKEVLRTIDPKVLPKNFGGVLEDPYSDPKMRPCVNGMMKVPVENYLDGEMVLKATDTGVKVITVKERSSYYHKVNIKKPGTIIKWTFQTKDYNIKFGLLFKNLNNQVKGKVQLEELVSVDFVESQSIPERGEISCEKAGQYLLHFDNRYSWMTPKQVLLKIEEHPLMEIIEG